MKTCLACLAMLIVGSLCGFAVATRQFRQEDVNYGPLEWDLEKPTDVNVPQSGRARVEVVGEAEFHFGTMAHDASMSHAFELRNTGDVPLKLEVADTTCSCTLGELDDNTVPPGQSTHVTLTWNAQGYDRDFRQSATLRTNDPERPSVVLSVAGQVLELIRPDPHDLALGEVARNEETDAQVRIYHYRDTDLPPMDLRFENPDTADHFQVSQRPLTAGEVSQETEARSGWLVTVRLLPGLPVGPLRQSLRVEFADDEVEPFSIPIHANVVSDVSIVAGEGFDRQQNILRLGKVPRQRGISRTLHLLVKGPHRDDVQLEIDQIDPAGAIQATIGSPRPTAAVLVYPVTIEIPPGSPTMSRLATDPEGLGRVHLTVRGGDTTELTILVSFVITEN